MDIGYITDFNSKLKPNCKVLPIFNIENLDVSENDNLDPGEGFDMLAEAVYSFDNLITVGTVIETTKFTDELLFGECTGIT